MHRGWGASYRKLPQSPSHPHRTKVLSSPHWFSLMVTNTSTRVRRHRPALPSTHCESRQAVFPVCAYFTGLMGALTVKCSLHMKTCILKSTRVLLRQLNGPRLECHPKSQKTTAPRDAAPAPRVATPFLMPRNLQVPGEDWLTSFYCRWLRG